MELNGGAIRFDKQKKETMENFILYATFVIIFIFNLIIFSIMLLTLLHCYFETRTNKRESYE